MKLLYFECNMGAAGDMIISALSQLFDNKENLLNEINAIGLPGITVDFENKQSLGINGIHTKILYNGKEENEFSQNNQHNYNIGIDYICSIIDNLNVSAKVKDDAKSIYRLIADAEADVHKCDVSAVHFHELGMMDAVADVVICSYLINKINPERICASPINTGSGQVKCCHGMMPVPAPATAVLLEGIPSYSNGIKGELCTPTGAAVLTYFVNEFCDRPISSYIKTGYGMGTKEFDEALNCIRVFFSDYDKDENVTLLSCNIDDISAEDLSFACELILKNGALDVWQTPVAMKKSRLAAVLNVLCLNNDKEKFINLIFKNTSTIGIRESEYLRHTLSRREDIIKTDYGDIPVKISEGRGVCKIKPEFEALKKLALENDIPIENLRQIVEKMIN
ncbi:MAG: nickel pincer cofactor biosynthesis protein LarC [Eubacterium sp.]